MKKKLRSTFLLESLEARLLFSADLAPLPVDAGVSRPEAESGLEISLQPDNGGVQAADAHEQLRQEIIFVDEGVDDYQRLIFDLESQLEQGRQFDIVALDSDHDGIAQISAYLRQHQDIDAVHVISHGADGEVVLGNSRLNATTLDGYAQAIEGWQQALTGDADLLFYGCDLAAGNDGQDLVNSLALLTGADVAASDDVTGSAKLGGDWELEYSNGEIETQGALTAILQPVWKGVLGQITVNTNSDTLDGDANTNNLADLAMNPGSDGMISLREAIKAANNDPDADTIFLEAEIYNITRLGAGDDFGDFDIREDLSIVGVSPVQSVIDGVDFNRVFEVHDGAAIKVSFSNLKIQDGYTGLNGPNGAGLLINGGANKPDVFLENVWFSENNSTFSTGHGGAIYNAGNLTITSALIEGNSADEGGGVWNATGGVLYMENVTLSGNSATNGDGGGLFNEGGTATLYHVTITENSASGTGGGVMHDGGAIETNIGNSIIAGNTASSSPDIAKFSGNITSAGGNIIQDAGNTGSNFAPSEIGIDPLLGGLTDNGGDLMTHEPAAVEAIDNADATISSAVDQRGFLRNDGSPDIGAHEVGASTTPVEADLWLSTDSVVVGGGQAGDDSWNPCDLIAIGDPELNLGPGTTSGTFTTAFDANGFSVGWDVNAADYVTAPIQIGSTNFQLQAGDLLLSPKYNGTIFTSNNVVPLDTGFQASVTADNRDLVVFRPDNVGDFSKGQFALLLEDVAGGHELRGITLVEQTITVGGRVLDASDFLYARSGAGDDHSIWLYETGDTGAGSTPDNRLEFLDGDDAGVGIQEQIHGIELLEDTMRVGNHVLAAGTILVNVDNSESVGSNGLDVDRFDVFALDVSTSSLVGAGQASAQMLFDGSDVAFDSNEEDMDAVMLVPNGAMPVNNAPTATNLSSTSFYNEGDGTVAITDIVVSDADTAETISATLTLANTAAGSLSATDGASYDGGTGIWTISGSVSAVNTALANLVFTPTTDNDVDTTITTHIEDAAGAGPADGAITLDVTPANDAPTATNLSSTSFYNEGDGTVAITDIVVSDADTAETISATLTLANTAAGSLSATDGASYDGGTGIWTISGSVSAVNTALANLVFTPTTDNDVDTTITTHIEDAAGAGPADGAITLDVTPANDAPTATNLSSTSFYNEGDGTVAITDIVVSDADTAETISATLTLANTAAGSLSATDGASYDGGTGIWTISGSVSAVNTALANLVFTPTTDNDVDTTITTHIEDAAGAGPADGAITLDVTPANDAPTATNLSSTSFYNEGDGTVAITDIVVSDADTAETISATLTLANTAAGSLSATDGASYDGGTGIWTISGSVSAVNTALANLVFTPTTDNDVDTTITTHIEDAAGAGPADGAITLDVTPANDAPTATNLSSTSFYNEGDGTVAITDIVVSDADTAETISATLTLANTAAGSLSATDGASYDGGTGIWTISGSVSAVNTALANLVFTPTTDNDVDTTITTHIEDAAGAGPADGAITLDVTPANDAPTATNLSSTSFYNEGDGTVAITDIVVSDADTAETISATLTLANTAAGSLSATDGASYDGGTGIWTISGSVSAVNTALANLVFTPTTDNDVDTTITTHIEDAAGAGPADGAITLDVTPANDAPTATNLSSTSFYNEGDGTVAITDIVVSDADTAETISATLTLANTAAGSLSATDGASYDGGTGIWTISGSVSAVNTALANLVFTPTTDNDVDTTITTHIEDAAGAGPADGAITLDVTPANDPGTVTIDNLTPAQGDTLTANVIDPDGVPATISYQWFSDGAAIGGASGKTYTTVQADVGTSITVSADYTDDQSTVESLTSAGTAAVTNVNDTPDAVNDNLNATEDHSMTITSVTDLLGNDSDIDGDTLTLSGFSQPANGMLVDNADGTLAYTPDSDFWGIDSFTYTISDGNSGTADGTAMIVVAPVGDTPQVTNVSTTAEVQSGLIFINRNASDGAEVSHFKLSGISNGSLYLADGVTGLDNGDFISVAQGQAGVRYTPAEGSTADGSFNVESSEDGVSVASQSGIATSIITVLTTASPPAASEPGPPLAEPEPVTDEDVVEEEAEATDDLVDETDVSVDAEDIFSVAKPQSYKAPSTAKPSFISGIADHNPANSDSDDKTLDRSTLLSPQSLKMLLEAQNLGELKTALGKLNITTLSSADYELVRNSLDAIKEEMGKEILLGKTVLGSAMATTVGLSAGYVVWMLKGGSLLASVLSSLPAWQLADPLAILVGKKDDDDDDDESLETIIKEGSGRDKDKKRKASELNNLRKDSAKR